MFDIIYTHSDFIVINKHPGVSVHKDDGDVMLMQEVAKYTGDKKLYLVHRLDKMTSGILLLARSSTAASELAQQFANREIQKFYLAIGSKKPKKKQGLVKGDMERSRRSSWKLSASHNNPAITQFFSLAADNGQRLFLCKPHTGKTHQIRVALKSVGSAIVGDPIYNPASDAERGYLHAFAIRFVYQNQPLSFICDPREFAQCGQLWHQSVVNEGLNQWLTPWDLPWPQIKNA
ncbi:TIGR01621 family pseudouridine synthase [Vibrio nitrifigilis]|uniref:TIGR01621 family pseudouridine synthase n=1 Tax=Vibrio nitrifigilis TaxID=2789781 RepID=A0ABS0GE88_9VIBR|nr:TIGR01621 family pseudouridine synthase [Vibrio nitrifigilis]MBF9000731.1 TIGR01621 family pseudouridine synthase [Vibrio nitrifigilis]